MSGGRGARAPSYLTDAVTKAGEPSGTTRKLESLFRYSPAFVLIAICILDTARSADPDLYGHLYFGTQVLRSGHIAYSDPYAYSSIARPWISHEWLSEVILAWCYNVGGVLGLNALKLGCSAVLVTLLILGMRETGASPTAQFAILILACVRMSAQMMYRPQIFTYMLLAATLAMLARDSFRRDARMWLLVPMFALWANLHGGFMVGLGALGVYSLVAGVQDLAAGRGAARLFHLSALTSACVLATVLTPYGTGTWLSVLHTIGNPRTLDVIEEWQPLISATVKEYSLHHFAILFDASAFSLFLGLLISLFLAPVMDDLPLLAVAAVMIAASFAQVRNLPLGIIGVMTPLAYHSSVAWRSWRAGQARPAPQHASMFGQIVVAIIAVALLAKTGFFSRRLRLSIDMPAGAVSFMKQHGITGNVLSDYSWSGYLIFHSDAKDKVFIDSRFEMIYPPKVINDFLAFAFDRKGADVALTRYPTEFVLIDPNTRASLVMARAPGWKLIYRDSGSLLYARVNSRAATMSGLPATGGKPATEFP